TQSRYRWGKLIDAEPSRFIEEIGEGFVEYLTPLTEQRYKPLIDADIFGEVDKTKIRLRKPKSSTSPKGPTENELRKLRRLKPVKSATNKNFDPSEANLKEGSQVEHLRFGVGTILKIEGVGADTKAEIDFENGGLKKLLLRFAKLNVLD
ncbi:MAG: ATP-dependent DNA helicase, partial [Bacteroidia bacterium]|nr:ATP-dependent DNA helicase [Bacteroidia bacterium]